MSELQTGTSNAAPDKKRKQGNYLILSIISASHGIFHFMSQSFSVMLPAIKETFGINPVQVGALITVKTLASGIASIPGGMISDYFRRHRGRLMMICMIAFALGWFIVSISPVYALLIVGMIVLSISGSVWHLPSLAVLGARFAKTRGTAMAIHGAGGSIGDILGPMVTGVLLGFMSWRGILSISSIIPFVMGIVIVWLLTGTGDGKKTAAEQEEDDEKVDFRLQLQAVKEVMRKTHIWRVNIVAGFRGMCFDIISTFFPLFMKDELGLSSSSIGFHFGLLWAIGITVSPLMGYLSDRFGRKRVLVPAVLYSSVLLVALALFGRGIMFTILIALLGVSIRSDYSILTATILDLVGDKVATTMLGILSFTRFMMAAAAPLIAGALYQYAGMDATLYFVAALFAIAGIIFMTADLTKKAVDTEASA